MFGTRVIGLNPKEAVLRYLGHEMPPSFDTYLMFDAGYANEDLHSDLLKEAGATFKCEEEIPVSWKVTVLDDNDEPVEFDVTGRPDRCMMVGDKVITVIEEKQIASSWKTKTLSHWGEATPKDENVVQNAHYAWQKDYANGILCYTSRAWHQLKTPRNTLIDGDHRAILQAGDWTFGVKPFVSLYDLTWEEDTLYFEGRKTVVTGERIKEFYEYIAHCITLKIIPDVHYSDIWGKPKTKSKVEAYYEWKDAPEDDFDTWVNYVAATCKEAWQEIEDELKECENAE
jgi:FMN phosphatase YigB (HAD superfamily)